jgi:hypothetical protein
MFFLQTTAKLAKEITQTIAIEIRKNNAIRKYLRNEKLLKNVKKTEKFMKFSEKNGFFSNFQKIQIANRINTAE